MNPGNKLRSIRERLKLTQAQMGDMLSLNRSYISELESGRKPVQDWVIQKAESVEQRLIDISPDLKKLHRKTGGKKPEDHLVTFSDFVAGTSTNSLIGALEYFVAQLNAAPVFSAALHRYAIASIHAEISRRIGL